MGTLYCTTNEFKSRAIPGSAVANSPDAQITPYLERASRVIDGYIPQEVCLTPLTQWDEAVTGLTADLATYYYVTERLGFDPNSGSDVTIKDRYDRALLTLRDVAQRIIRLNVVGTTNPSGVSKENKLIVVGTAKFDWSQF